MTSRMQGCLAALLQPQHFAEGPKDCRALAAVQAQIAPDLDATVADSHVSSLLAICNRLHATV